MSFENINARGFFIDSPELVEVVNPEELERRITQINVTDWPSNAISDINYGRAALQGRGYIGGHFTLVGPSLTLDLLDVIIPNTNITYRRFLLYNGLVEDIRNSDSIGMSLVASFYETESSAPASLKAYSRFSDEAKEKAWTLLEEYMTPTQYFAFMEGSKIELKNKAKDFRLLIDKDGNFVVLEGKIGEGMVATSGRIKSYNYPLGDEIAAFLDWFNYKTKELIAQWNCGTYGIVKEGERR